MKQVNQDFDNQLFSLSTPRIALVFIINCPMEEFLFRVAIHGVIAKHGNLPIAIATTTFLFCIMHIRYVKYWYMMLASAWVSIVWGVVFAATNSWTLVVFAHFTHNITLSFIEKTKADVYGGGN